MKFETNTEHSTVRWHNMDKSMSEVYLVAEETPDHMTFKRDEREGTGPDIIFAMTRPDGNHLTLKGKVGADELEVTLYRLDVAASPLMTRGFHWISERPYNR